MKVEEGDPSDAFALDGAGTTQRLTCVSNKQRYEISVRIKFCSFQLSKILTFEPYFIVVNQTTVSYMHLYKFAETCYLVNVKATSVCMGHFS